MFIVLLPSQPPPLFWRSVPRCARSAHISTPRTVSGWSHALYPLSSLPSYQGDSPSCGSRVSKPDRAGRWDGKLFVPGPGVLSATSPIRLRRKNRSLRLSTVLRGWPLPGQAGSSKSIVALIQTPAPRSASLRPCYLDGSLSENTGGRSGRPTTQYCTS